MTEYIILKSEDQGRWKKLEGIAKASSARAALRDALDGDTGGGEFVAIPARSWQPVKVQVEQALKFS